MWVRGESMRARRVLAEEGSQGACYRCVTRVVDRRFALGDHPEKGTVRDRQSIKVRVDPSLDVGEW